MTRDLSLAQLRRLRLQNQQLADASRSTSTALVVRRLCALQSQEWPSAQLAIAARTQGITYEDVKRAREIDRSFVLTWSLRGTLHLVAAEDISWQLALSGERAIRGTNRRYLQLGLSEIVREKALDHVAEILAQDGPLIRAELADKLRRACHSGRRASHPPPRALRRVARSHLPGSRTRGRFDLRAASRMVAGLPAAGSD